ncbi:MAG: TPM domain-containing protein [Bacteroidota bacterium]
MKAIDFFSDTDKESITAAIRDAEKMTSGEIRVYIEDSSKKDMMDRAAFVFAEMNMHRTKNRNGVLIYVAFQDRKFAVIGDAGIHKIVGQDFWDSVKDLMLQRFKNNQFSAGITDAVKEAGKVLAAHFPYQEGDDKNELSDDVMIR